MRGRVHGALADCASVISYLDGDGLGAEVAGASNADPQQIDLPAGDGIVCALTNVRKTGSLELLNRPFPRLMQVFLSCRSTDRRWRQR
ncbi:MAG: hypothetical protein KDH88_06770 [Chromatiales bacterium]|nr:hypothetical protein [Chromatiales bacterium]